MFKKTAVALSFCWALAGAGGAAQADTFLFNPAGTGAGGAFAVTSIDWLQGNVLAVAGGGLITTGSIVQDLYQSNLDSLVNGSTNVFSNGTGGNFFTAVASFFEQATSVFIGGGFATATFDNTAATQGLPSFFRICAQSALATDLTGAGFACTAANAILTGTLTDLIGAVTAVNLSTVPAPFGTGLPSLLDQFGPDNWAGQLTASSIGGANVLIRVTSVNTGYFPDLNVGTTIVTALTNTSFITPFNQQNPSYCFSSNGTTSSTSGTTVCSAGTQQAFGTLGAINGGGPFGGPNFIFQADANTSITRSVPEPETLLLFGLGLALLSLQYRHRKQ